MNCHNQTKTESDFLWSLEVNAFPTTTPSIAMQFSAMRNGFAPTAAKPKSTKLDKPLKQLKTLMQNAAKN